MANPYQLNTMKFDQSYIPSYNYCTMCGVECENETCHSKCHWKLQKLRSFIDEKKKEEKGGNGQSWNMVSIKRLRQLNDLIR